MRYKWFIPVTAFAVILPMSSQEARSSCADFAPFPSELAGGYPLHELSPLESLKAHDTVFLAEVLVATRKCSLGYCAGLKVLRSVKGKPAGNLLVSIRHPKRDQCGPRLFQRKGSRWLVFGNTGTSPGGTAYMEVDPRGPTYASTRTPNFRELEKSYVAFKTRLDQAIESRLPPSRRRLR